MKRHILLIGLVLIASGCVNSAKVLTVHIDAAPISDDKATVILYHRSNYKQGFLNEYPITIDGSLSGTVIAEQPLKISLNEGTHTLLTSSFGLKSKGVTQHFSAGEVYYFSVQKNYNMLYDTLVISPSDEIKYYEIISHR